MEEPRRRRWVVILRGTVNQIRVDNVPLLAGGVSFYAMLALVPALGAAVSLYGLVVTRAQVDSEIASLTTALPAEARQLVVSQLRMITASSSSGLQLSFGAGLAAALWSASSGMRWMLAALTAAAGQRETRKFVRLRSLALLMTLGAIVALGISAGALLALPAVLDALGLGGVARVTIEVVRFPALGGVILASLALLYRYGPDRPASDRPADEKPRVEWVTWGSAIAASVWVVGSSGLSIYVANASKFKAAGTYGALGAVVVLLLWLWISAFAVILGAVVNTQVQRTEVA